MSSKIKLLQKIKALAERGADGEKETAQAILQQLMKKYGVTDAELEQDEKKLTWFRYKDSNDERLLLQIIYMVTGNVAYQCKRERKLKQLGADCTIVDKMEIELNFEFYKRAMVKELEIFFSAFASKNGLYPSKEKDNVKNKPINTENVEKIMAMMNGMDQHTLRKMIE